MRIYSLTLQAIGPFAGRHDIDFAALGRSGTFLLEGPTGAGKSTIIDAIVFALYGQLSGESSSKDRLHSHHAAQGVEPYVDLVFEVESGVYRVRRSPSHQRIKRRGIGTTTQNESVVLTRLHDVDDPAGGEVLSTRAQEVGHEIGELIGLQRDQFLQTVVLPQGEFATFLRSTGEERKKLLETIFRTDVYESMTRTLVEMRREAQQRTRAAADRARIATEGLAAAAHVESATLLDVSGRLDPERCDALLSDVETAARDARKAATEAKDTLDERTAALRAAEALAHALVTRDQLLRRRTALDARSSEIDAWVEAIDAALHASAVRATILAADRAAREAREAQSILQQAAEALGGEQLTLRESSDAERAVTERLTRLERFIALEAGFADRQGDLESLREQIAEGRTRLAVVESRIEARPAHRAALRDDLERQVLVARGLAAVEVARDDAQRILSSARRLEQVAARRAEAQARLDDAVAAARRALAHHTELRRRRIEGMAGELASSLVSGEACVVCGSLEHPRPAVRPDDHPSEHDLDEADRLAAAADRDLVAARSAVDRLDVELAAERDAARDLTVEQAAAAMSAAVAAVDDAVRGAERHAELVAALQRLDTDAGADNELRARLEESLSASVEREERLSVALSDDRAAVAEVLTDDAKSLALLTDQLQQRRTLLLRYAEALRARDHARRALKQADDAVAAELARQDFDDVEAALAAALPAADIERLDRQVDEHRQEAAIVRDGLTRPEIAILTGDEDPQVELARTRRDEAEQQHTELAGVAAAARQRHEQVRDRHAVLAEALRASTAADAEATAIIRMADVADASSRVNLKRLTLGTYVLMRRFEDVVAAANARLGPMSSGRYQLRATDERERSGRGSRTGLSLAVLDAETRQEREPRTLSGGETFYASLCLALGLADVVTAEAGGIELGTLFVDEGFGSLDPATLADVMAELSGLARGGRVVGIVSHVEDLKQQVADRIEVRQLADGSSTLTVRASHVSRGPAVVGAPG